MSEGIAIWFLPSTGKWYVGLIDEECCAGRDFIDCQVHLPEEYGTLREALKDKRIEPPRIWVTQGPKGLSERKLLSALEKLRAGETTA